MFCACLVVCACARASGCTSMSSRSAHWYQHEPREPLHTAPFHCNAAELESYIGTGSIDLRLARGASCDACLTVARRRAQAAGIGTSTRTGRTEELRNFSDEVKHRPPSMRHHMPCITDQRSPLAAEPVPSAAFLTRMSKLLNPEIRTWYEYDQQISSIWAHV